MPRKTTPAAKEPRRKRSEQERAVEALGIAARKVERLETDLERARGQVAALEGLLAAARRRYEHEASDPALTTADLAGMPGHDEDGVPLETTGADGTETTGGSQ